MAKRKRQAAATPAAPAAGGEVPEPQTNKKFKAVEKPKAEKPKAEKSAPAAEKKPKAAAEKPSTSKAPKIVETIQIITGSYDRVLHGIVATVQSNDETEFADTFLFNAHTSAIRCLAVSPPSAPAPNKSQKVVLASGSTDERINLYHLSAHPPSRKNQDVLTKVAARPILENPKNQELGTLLHHESTVTALAFPSKSKLLSSSEDSSIAVTRTRDWSVLSTIKAPIPQPLGRPSGDTAAFGGTPSGVNDFAIHPSMKLMITVSKGERCMRLWNLVTGKKAGVLNFGRRMLSEAGEGKHCTGEGRKVVWGSVDGAEEFAVGFEKDVVVFGMDSVPKCRVMGATKTKIHQVSYLALDEDESSVMAVATEDGRIMFFSTQAEHLAQPESEETQLASAKLVGYVGGKDAGVAGRIKDFVLVRSAVDTDAVYVVAGSSDGKLRVWRLSVAALQKACAAAPAKEEKQLGQLIGMNQTHNRITCMAAYLMIPRAEGVEDSDEEFDDLESEAEEDSEEE
jgi:protein MAK11